VEFDATVLHLHRNQVIIANDVPEKMRLITSRLEGWSSGTEVRIAVDASDSSTPEISPAPEPTPVDATKP
jgi:hypothetical protein